MIDDSCKNSFSGKSPFMVALSFYGIVRLWRKICKNTCYEVLAIIAFALLPSSRFNLHIYFRIFCQTSIIKMPSSIQNEKIRCENCVTQTTRNTIVRHKKSCSAGTLYCTYSPNFSTKSRSDLNHHVAKKHSVPRPSIACKSKLSHAEFPGFSALRQQKNTQHGTEIGFGATNIHVEDIV